MLKRVKQFQEVARTDGFKRAFHLTFKYLFSTVPRRGIPYYYQLLAWVNWQRSGSYQYRPDPYKIVELNPSKIKYVSGNRFSYLTNMYYDSGRVVQGTWDQSEELFADRPVYTSFRMRFCDNEDWSNTPLVKTAIEQLERGGPVWKDCKSKDEIMQQCAEYDALYEDIREGYRSRKTLLRAKNQIPTNPQWFWQSHDEVVVNIGRDGGYLFVGGHHRLSIAKVLELNTIPVRVFVRHASWQKTIDDIYAGHTEWFDHPDLLEIR